MAVAGDFVCYVGWLFIKPKIPKSVEIWGLVQDATVCNSEA
jgi:hypothetical protein